VNLLINLGIEVGVPGVLLVKGILIRVDWLLNWFLRRIRLKSLLVCQNGEILKIRLVFLLRQSEFLLNGLGEKFFPFKEIIFSLELSGAISGVFLLINKGVAISLVFSLIGRIGVQIIKEALFACGFVNQI